MALGVHVKDDNSAKVRKRRKTERRGRKCRTVEDTKDDDGPTKSSKLLLQGRQKMSMGARRTQVKVFVEHTLRTGVAGLIAEFKAMKRTNDFKVMTEFVAQIPNKRNRYKDVGCLDFQRVVLNIGPVSYIHANYVATPASPKRFICTQAPLPNTCADFWYMVVQEKSDAIMMLCNFVEQGSKKSAEYVPLSFETSPMTFEGVTVTLKKKEQFQFPINTKVIIGMSSLEVKVPSEPVHQCIHYHWKDWPDRGVPEADLAPVYLLTKIQSTTTPIIVHCSAGIGRTGSIVLIQHAMEILNSTAPLGEIRGLLQSLRKQRNNSIQTEHQYLYVHQVLLLYLKKLKYFDESATQYLDQFTADYQAATKGF